MITVNIYEAKTNLSKHIEAVEKGETVVICRRNIPVAEIRSLDNGPKPGRSIGVATELYGDYSLPECFWDPLPDEVISSFEGG